MRKYVNNMMTMAVLLVAAAAITACSGDDVMTQQPVEPLVTEQADQPIYTLTIDATKGDDAMTRALELSDDGKTLYSMWSEDDQVTVSVQEGEEAASGAVSEVTSWTLTPTEISKDGLSCKLTGTITKNISGQTLNLSIKRKTTSYKKQDGTLAYIADNCDHASCSVTVADVQEVTQDGKTAYQVTTTPAKFLNEQAIVRFTLKAPDGTLFSPTKLTVTIGGNVGAELPAIPASTYTTNGEGVLYVAVPTKSTSVMLTASNSTETWYYVKNTSFQKGKFYSITVTMKPGNVDLAALSADYTAKDGDVLYGTMPEGLKLSIAKGATVTLYDVTCKGGWDDKYYPAINCKGNATITLMGTNRTDGGGLGDAGIFVPSGSTLTIQGDGSLEAQGGIYCAGIGGNLSTDCGNIIISGGTVTATGGSSAAGIGAGQYASCGTITISGGTVTATGSMYGAGIGTAESKESNVTCGKITISGGTVTATGGDDAAGIGSGNKNGDGTNKCNSILISGGTVTATGGSSAAGIGTGEDASCGTITIKATTTKLTATKGNGSKHSIGAGNGGTCGTVKIGDETYENGISKSPYTYQP